MSSKYADVAARGGRGKKRKALLAEQQRRLLAAGDASDASLPASAAYTRIVDFEREVDATLGRRKAEVNEALKRAERVPRTVRVYVYNTFKPASKSIVTPAEGGGKDRGAKRGARSADGATGAPIEEEIEPASWTLHVQGRVLSQDEAPDGRGDKHADAECDLKFSSFVRSVEVRLDPAHYAADSLPPPEGQGAEDDASVGPSVIAWNADDASPDAPAVDGFEVKRHGDADCVCKIILRIDHQPERYAVSPRLAAILGVDLETRPRLIGALMQYVKLHDLLDAEDAGTVVMNDALREVFVDGAGLKGNGKGLKGLRVTDGDKALFADIAERLHDHLEPAPPIEIDYVIRTRGTRNPTLPECYDLLLDVPSTATSGYHQFVERLGRDREIDACDARIKAALRKIEEHERRRKFFLEFSRSPTAFINRVVAAQARDVAVVRHDGATRREAERNKELYDQPWVDEALMRYISRKGTG